MKHQDEDQKKKTELAKQDGDVSRVGAIVKLRHDEEPEGVEWVGPYISNDSWLKLLTQKPPEGT